MLKFTVALLISGMVSLAAQAQTTPPPVAPPVAGPVPELSAGRRDTLTAIARLYERRRKGGKVWLGIAVGGVLTLARVATSSGSSSGPPNGVPTSSEVDGGAVALIGGLFVGLPGLLGVSKLARFSEAAEQAADRAYRSGQPLPRSLRAALSKQDFE